MKKKPIITVVGSYIVALTMRSDRFPTPGETLTGHSFTQFYGGKGSNQAVGCSRLGADVNFIACIITLGERGAYIATEDFSRTVPSQKVDVVDTTGAGDSFTAALGVAVSEGKPLPEAVEFAICASALAVTGYGVIDSLPYRKQVEDFMFNNKHKLHE